jgi:hypothetical protein
LPDRTGPPQVLRQRPDQLRGRHGLRERRALPGTLRGELAGRGALRDEDGHGAERNGRDGRQGEPPALRSARLLGVAVLTIDMVPPHATWHGLAFAASGDPPAMGPMTARPGGNPPGANRGARGTALTEVRGGTRGCASLIEMIGSAVAVQSKIQYLLPRSRRARLARNFTQFLCQLAVMPTIHRRDGRFRFSHDCSPSAARSRG